MATIVRFENSLHRVAVAELWSACFGHGSARNQPGLVIDKKVAEDDDLFFVAVGGDGDLIGTAMGGYDGHRGWIYSLAVASPNRRCGIGRALIERVEAVLRDRGCVKINLQILEGNRGVVGFYEKLGYTAEPRISMGKTLPENIPLGD